MRCGKSLPRAASHSHLAETALWLVEACEAEISQFQVELARFKRFLRGKEYVFRLDISVSDVLFVHVVESK